MTTTPATAQGPRATRARDWLARWRLRGLEGRLRRHMPQVGAAAASIPPAIRAAWFAVIDREAPRWRADERDWQLASLALLQFFEVCCMQGEQACALPSKAADSVWHVWLERDAAGLGDWQRRHFGRAIPHREAAELGAPLPEALARTWASACRSEGLSPLAGRLPLLFVIDGRLAMPGGWAYGRTFGRVHHRDIGPDGRRTGLPRLHAGLAAAGLAACGALTAAELRELERINASSSGGSGCGSSGGLSSDCSSSDGGSSCGSSCGGGCGS